MKEKIVTEYLQCVLTPEEKANRAEIAARADGEIKRIAEEKAVMVSGYASQTKEQQRVHDKASECVRTGVETRNVQVRVTYDLSDGIVRYRRLDTEEVYERRKITEEERRAIKAEEDALSLPFGAEDEEDDSEHQQEPVGKEIAPTDDGDTWETTVLKNDEFDDSDPFAPEPRDPLEWISLEDERPAEDVEVETGRFDPITETVVYESKGFIYAEWDQAWKQDRMGELGQKVEWEVSHFRYIQPDTDAQTAEGEAD